MNPSYNNGNGSNVGGQPNQPAGGIFSRNENVGAPGASGAPGAPGAAGAPGAPGVIASGPDPTDAPAGAASGLSLGNKHLFRKPRVTTPNRNMVVNIGGTAPRGNSGGPKKGLIIGGLIAVVVMVVVLVVFLVMPRGSGVNTDTAFSNVAKYLLFGNVESDKKISDAEIRDVAFVNIAENATYEEQKTFFENTNNYIQTLTQASRNSGLTQDIVELADVINLYGNLAMITYGGGLWDAYLENGTNGLDAYREKFEVMQFDDQNYMNMIVAAESYIDYSAELYKKFGNAKCIKDGEADDECMGAVAENDEEVSRIQLSMVGPRVRIYEYINTLSETIFEDLNTLAEEIENA